MNPESPSFAESVLVLLLAGAILGALFLLAPETMRWLGDLLAAAPIAP